MLLELQKFDLRPSDTHIDDAAVEVLELVLSVNV